VRELLISVPVDTRTRDPKLPKLEIKQHPGSGAALPIYVPYLGPLQIRQASDAFGIAGPHD
jgi:hypothetical protein